MEKIPHQEYRDELAEKLVEIRNSDLENPEIAKAKAQGYLLAKKESDLYVDSKTSHISQNKYEAYQAEVSAYADRLKHDLVQLQQDPEIGFIFENAEVKVLDAQDSFKEGVNTKDSVILNLADKENDDALSKEDPKRMRLLLKNKDRLPDSFKNKNTFQIGYFIQEEESDTFYQQNPQLRNAIDTFKKETGEGKSAGVFLSFDALEDYNGIRKGGGNIQFGFDDEIKDFTISFHFKYAVSVLPTGATVGFNPALLNDLPESVLDSIEG